MIIKSPDNKQPQKDALLALLNHPDADSTTRKRIEQEIRNIQAGARGEEEAAYEMKVHYGNSENWMIIHDLRIEYGGNVAQIDHLVINRWLKMWVCESKHFSEGVAINEHGEFSAFFGNKPYGVPSPIEQNNRHILILQRLFDAGVVDLPKRLGFTIKPELTSMILVSKGARISRPKKNIPGLDAMVKSDMFFKTIEKSMDDVSPLVLAKVVSTDTLKNLAHDIAKLHRPIKFNWLAKFGLTENIQTTGNKPQAEQAVRPKKTQAAEPTTQKTLACHSCGQSVAHNVASFCRFNKSRFGGNLYCIACQKTIASA